VGLPEEGTPEPQKGLPPDIGKSVTMAMSSHFPGAILASPLVSKYTLFSL
jgi:hypothetical protein